MLKDSEILENAGKCQHLGNLGMLSKMLVSNILLTYLLTENT